MIAGQGPWPTRSSCLGTGAFDRVYLQIGVGYGHWGGLLLRHFYPNIEIIGVEGTHQASMQAALSAGKPVTLDYLDVFCDGTAVKKTGSITRHLFSQVVDRFVTVTNEEVCAAISNAMGKPPRDSRTFWGDGAGRLVEGTGGVSGQKGPDGTLWRQYGLWSVGLDSSATRRSIDPPNDVFIAFIFRSVRGHCFPYWKAI